MNLTLYANRLSQPCRAVEILLRELDVPYTWHEVDFANGQAREPWFAERINALKTIPALLETADDDPAMNADFRLGESHAIQRYICRQADNQEKARCWYPGEQDSRRAAKIDQWLAWHHGNIRCHDTFHDIMNLHLTLPMLKYELQQTRIRPLQERLKSSLALLEHHFKHQDASAITLCGGKHSTLADLSMVCELYQIIAIGYRLPGYPRVARWIDTIASRPHFQNVSSEIIAQGRSIREQSGGYLDLEHTFI
ncbi:glutathione S-transferase family protein [Pistricoccus aurantiacus]|uniref:Glutathione S-transferase family protein n=1 Tax=Pistricoccus aurantiacus TaxID=1883414 RepID=A0A5B8SWH9_9GAMM|nr:glutathione S-transferase family protein [Pistricoccus aurantiacus]QEA39935.1 glutathione S-transferase family protein [Pistricoccus aurantiacus]